MRVVFAFALAACVVPSVDAFSATPSLRTAGRSLAGNLCMTADDELQQLTRRTMLSSAVVAAASLAVTEPAWAQAVAGRKKVSKPQDKNIEKSAARARTQLALLEKECEKCKDGLCRACKDLEARNNKDAGPAAVAAADAPEAEE